MKYNQKDIDYIVNMISHIIPVLRDAIKEDMCRQMEIPVEVIDEELKESLK